MERLVRIREIAKQMDLASKSTKEGSSLRHLEISRRISRDLSKIVQILTVAGYQLASCDSVACCQLERCDSEEKSNF